MPALLAPAPSAGAAYRLVSRQCVPLSCQSVHLSLCLCVCGRDPSHILQQRIERKAATTMTRKQRKGNVTLLWASPLEGVLPAWPGAV